ncbi:MAG: sulfur carrier protein ThiS [Candidatus Omnitrophica bacterium]|jgi:thiamine biosynthesis protein ThiS|nr:sulfur carrier protein ThiS [Candidatus Omnitrophota bacterium]
MRIKINGRFHEIEGAGNLPELIKIKGLSERAIVIEYNHNIIPKDKWNEIILREGDIIEIVSFVGGG